MRGAGEPRLCPLLEARAGPPSSLATPLMSSYRTLNLLVCRGGGAGATIAQACDRAPIQPRRLHQPRPRNTLQRCDECHPFLDHAADQRIPCTPPQDYEPARRRPLRAGLIHCQHMYGSMPPLDDGATVQLSCRRTLPHRAPESSSRHAHDTSQVRSWREMVRM